MLEAIGKKVAEHEIAKFEKEWDYDMSYAREMMDANFEAFRGFGEVAKLGALRGVAPAEAMYAAKLATTMAEDCGPCAQLIATMAEREGVDAATLRAIVAGNVNAMPANASLGYRFAKATLAHDLAELDRLRAEISQRWGKSGVVELALAIAMARVYPTVKYAMGYGHACQQIRVAGTAVRREPMARATTVPTSDGRA
jgi:succinate dehydrogenase/fumarate reductase flavoprotein subunit